MKSYKNHILPAPQAQMGCCLVLKGENAPSDCFFRDPHHPLPEVSLGFWGSGFKVFSVFFGFPTFFRFCKCLVFCDIKVLNINLTDG